MKKSLLILFIIAISSLNLNNVFAENISLISTNSEKTSVENKAEYVKGELLVWLKDNTNNEYAIRMIEKIPWVQLKKNLWFNILHITVIEGKEQEFIKKLEELDFVKYAELNQIVTITTDQKIVWWDSDSHGCKGSAGYIWSEFKKECVRPWEQIAPKEQLRQCESYFDWCNICSVNKDWTLWGCTEMSCQSLKEPKCLKQRKKVAEKWEFCGWILGVTCSEWLSCKLDGLFPDAGWVCEVKKVNEELKQCKTYYDGCNTCSVNEDGSLWACTLMFCQEKQTPKCLEKKEEPKQEYKFEKMCSMLDGEPNDTRLKIAPYCDVKEIWRVFDFELKAIYNDIIWDSVYIWWSKYFDESKKMYNTDLMILDYKVLGKLIKSNKLSLNLQDKAKILQKKLEEDLWKKLTWKQYFAFKLWDKLSDELKKQVKKYVSKIEKITENRIEKERLLIAKTKQFEDIITKLNKKNNKTQKDKDLIILLTYAMMLIEENIAYE